MSHIIFKIDINKVNQEWFFKGQKGTYLDIVAYQNDTVDQFGNSHVIKQNPPKEAREAGAKGIIIGNGKWMNQGASRPASKPAQRGFTARPEPKQEEPNGWGGKTLQQQADELDESSIPF